MINQKDIHSLLKSWGFSENDKAPEFLKEHAISCLKSEGLKIGEIVVNLKLADYNQVEPLLKSKPSNVLSLEVLSQGIPSVRQNSLKILAIKRAIPYLEYIDDKWVLEGVPYLNSAVKVVLNNLNAVLIITPSKKSMLVFSDLSSLLEFSQVGSVAKLQDPIRQALSEEPIVALASPAILAKASSLSDTDETAIITVANQDNYWGSIQAKTEAEKMLARIFDEALSKKATDLSIQPLRDGTAKVMMRRYGDMVTVDRYAVLSPEQSREITNFLISKSRAGDGSRLRQAADGSMTYKNAAIEAFLRTSFIPADRAGLEFDMISSSIRFMPRTSKNIYLKDLNLHKSVGTEVNSALLKSQGLIVLAGPTNSGKSTTIAGIVGEHIKAYGSTKKRISLEDPVERYLEGIMQVSVDDGNFAELIRALLRHDPDMIWIGEIRDAFSAAACVRAATSGHIVVSTVHANNSMLAFRAIANYLRKDTGETTGAGASIFDLAESISLIVGQRLVKRLCPHCRQKFSLKEKEFKMVDAYLKAEGLASEIPRSLELLAEGAYKSNASGCSECNNTGYTGEIPINELLPVNRDVKDIFGRSESKLDVPALSKHRTLTLTSCALELIKKGEIEFTSLFV